MKKLSLLALLCSLMFLFAACATPDEPTPGTDTGTETATAGNDEDGADDEGADDGGVADDGGADDGGADDGGADDGGADGGTDGGTTPPTDGPAAICDGTAATDELAVIFDQPALGEAVKFELNRVEGIEFAEGEDVTCEQIEELENVTYPVPETEDPEALNDLGGLENALNLLILNVTSNEVSDLSPLTNLGELQQLYLGVNEIEDLTPLAGLTNLSLLYLVFNEDIDDEALTPILNEGLWTGDNDDVQLQGTDVTQVGVDALIAAGVEEASIAGGGGEGPEDPADPADPADPED